MPEGNYMLTAYTRLAENMGPDYFFRKNITVKSPYRAGFEIKYELQQDDNAIELTYCEADGSPRRYSSMSCRTVSGKESEGMWGKGRKRFKVDRENGDVVLARFEDYSKFFSVPALNRDVDVTFHPEGGYLIAGEPNKLAFKALDASGHGIDARGVIVDSLGNAVTEFRTLHNGMGVVAFIPESGMDYTARVSIHDGLTRDFRLPAATADAVVLNIDNRPSRLTIKSSGNVRGDETLVLQCRGVMLYAKTLGLGELLTIDKRDLPTGVVQALLLAGSGETLSQRLFFVNNGVVPDALLSEVDSVRPHSKVTLQLDVTNRTDTAGNVAVAVNDVSLIGADRPVSIKAQLLLQGDLKGYVESPDYYFNRDDHAVAMALDALMLTQGWTRYDIPAVLTGDYQKPLIPLEEKARITGLVKSFWRGKPMKDATVSTIAPRQAYAEVVPTDGEGHFLITGVDFPDDTKFVFQATNKKGGHESNFNIDTPVYPESALIPAEADTSEVEDADVIDLIKRSGRFSVLLNEMTVRGQRRRKKPEDIYEILAAKSYDEKYFEERKITTI